MFQTPKKLSPKNIVETCFGKPVSELDWEEVEQLGGALRYSIKCPKCSKVLTTDRKTNYTNLGSHMNGCYGMPMIESMYLEQKEKGLVPGSGGQATMHMYGAANERELLLNQWIQLVVLHFIPLSKTRDKDFRRLLKFDKPISSKTIVDTMEHLKAIVEEKIKDELDGKKVGLIHDGWSCYGFHFLALLVSYMKDEEDVEPTIAMMSVNTLNQVTDDGNLTQDDADEFNTRIHVANIKSVLSTYGISAGTNVVCQTADNTNLNPAIARGLGIVHIACRNHSLQTAGTDMQTADAELTGAMDKLQLLHRNLQSNKNSARLRNIQAKAIEESGDRKHNKMQRPKLMCVTRWGANAQVIANHFKVLPAIKKVMEKNAEDGRSTTGSEILNDEFKEMLDKHHVYLKVIGEVIKRLQKRGCSIAESQALLDVLVNAKNENRDGFENSRLDPTKISLAGNCDSDKPFVSGVIKIIDGKEANMSEEERSSCECLLKDEEDGSGTNDAVEEDGGNDLIMDVLNERKRRREAMAAPKSRYRNASFVTGSASEVEGVWSFGDALYTKRRSSMSPVLFELIMFLRYNAKWWTMEDVIAANKRRLEGNKAGKVTTVQQFQAEWANVVAELGAEFADEDTYEEIQEAAI